MTDTTGIPFPLWSHPTAGTGAYLPNAQYPLTITPPANAVIDLMFTYYNTEASFDFIWLFNGLVTGCITAAACTTPLLAPKIGSLTMPAVTTYRTTVPGAPLTIWFSSDGSGNYNG
jgi:hypothetical protein